MENIWSNTRWWNKQFQSNILYIQIRRLKKILQIFRSHVHRIRINAKWETVFIEYLSSITSPLRAIFRILGGEGGIPLAAVFVQNPLKENAELRFPYPPSSGWIEKRSERNGESSLGNTRQSCTTSETSNVGHYLVAIVTHWRGPGSQLLYVYTLSPSSFLLFPPRRLHQRLKLETISRDIQIIMPLGYNGRSIGVHRGGTSK